MSEYTCIYLREKGRPLLSSRTYPSYEDLAGKTEEEIRACQEEVEAHNRKALDSYGCEMFHLSTTPSRQMEVLPWAEEPRELSMDLLEEVLSFYEDKIQSLKGFMDAQKERLATLERRILKADVKLYDRINEDIENAKDCIKDVLEELDVWQYHYSRFVFVRDIMSGGRNSESYELIFTKC